MKLNNLSKIFILLFVFVVAGIGFLIKLPAVFHHIDKGLHTLFYFGAAAFLNILFANKKLFTHAFIFGFLYVFGIAIEYAQEYSNKLMHRRIHGRYDPEDVAANLKGLLLFSALWLVYTGVLFLYRMKKRGLAKNSLE
jgi:hypothetical protein